jgi:hypothetical protein
LLEEQPPGELKPHRFMSEMELYTRWLLACGSKELERVWQLRLLTQTWGGERCGRRRHARREDERRELHEEGSGCQAELHEEGSNCQARPWTARAANGR